MGADTTKVGRGAGPCQPGAMVAKLEPPASNGETRMAARISRLERAFVLIHRVVYDLQVIASRSGPDYSETPAAHCGVGRDGRHREMIVEALMATAVVVAVGAALLRSPSCSCSWLAARRRAPRGQQELVELVSELSTRMERMVRELSEALERAQEEGRRNRRSASSAASIDLDEVLARTLDAAGAMRASTRRSSRSRRRREAARRDARACQRRRRDARRSPARRTGARRARSRSLPVPARARRARTLVHPGLAVPVPRADGGRSASSRSSRASPSHRFERAT